MRKALITLPSGATYTVAPWGARFALYRGADMVSRRHADSLEDAVSAWLGERSDAPRVDYVGADE